MLIRVWSHITRWV